MTNNQNRDKVVSDMNALTTYISYECGSISINKDGELVDSEGNPIEGNIDALDRIYQDLSDVTTLFKKDGDDFVIVETNIRGEDGKSITGVKMDTSIEAYETLIEGKEFSGDSVINGKKYVSSYNPLRDSKGDVIGVLFVGVPTEYIEADINNSLKNIQLIYGITVIVSIIISIIITSIISKGIINTLIKTVKYAENIQNLDVSKDLPDTLMGLKDEVGQLSKSIHTAVINLRGFARDSDEMSEEVKEYSEELLKGMEQISMTASEISNVVVEIAQGATKQARDTEEGSNKIEELGTYIEESREQVNDLNELMKKVDKLKDNGVNAMYILAKESKESTESANEIYDVIVDTNDKAKEIEKASDMIKEIAEQTNLLALNAAIESARAGESGKGFAVVAEEIRKLAEESNKFTEEIKLIIEELTNRTESAVKTVDKMNKIMDNQSRGVKYTTENFDGISDGLKESIESLVHINNTSEKMEEMKKEIIGIVENLSAIAEENAASTEEVAASVQEQTSTITEFNSSVNKMAELSEKMKKNISRFKYK